jgi:hypothetical protein
MLTPQDMIDTYPHMTLTINSTDDTRKKKYKDNYTKFQHLDPSTIALRYEPDTDFLFIDASWLSPEEAKDLFLNTQYKGKTTVRLLKGTGHAPERNQTISAHVFDMKATSARRVLTDNTKRRGIRYKLMQELKGDVRAVAAKLQEYDAYDAKLDNEVDKDEKIRELKRQLARLRKDEIRRMEGYKPIKRNIQKLGKLESLDIFIQNNRNKISADITRIVVENRIPRYEKQQAFAEGNAIGVLKESINLDGTNHKKKLALEVRAIKTKIPNYRRDSRYTTSQSVYVKHKGADGSLQTKIIYCACFDLLG